MLAPFTVAVLVYYQDALPVGRGLRVRPQQLDPAAVVHGPRVPPRLRQEPLQTLHFLTLCSDYRLGVGKRRERLVALGRKQEPFEVAPKAPALSASPEKIIEAGGIPFERAGSGGYGRSFGHLRTPPPPLEHSR